MKTLGSLLPTIKSGVAQTRRVLARGRDWLVSWVLALRATRVQWSVAQVDGRHRITKNGVPFELRGFAGWDCVRLDEIPRFGGNAFRCRVDLPGLNRAWRLGLQVLVNLPVRGEAAGIDWDNVEQVERQIRETIRIVRRLKHHPAVMMWSVGNEVDLIPFHPGDPLPPHPRCWEHLNDLARAVKREDPRHLVCVCTGTGRIEVFEDKITAVARDCRDIDLLGLNNFRDTARAISILTRMWKRPFVFSEWGTSPAWRAPETSWGALIEPPSSKKAALVSQRYKSLIRPARLCVGGFLYFWGERNERTHTWFGLFHAGKRTQSLDVIHKHWMGTWPEKPAPSVLGVSIMGHEKETDILLNPKEACEARVTSREATWPETTVTWHLRAEVFRAPKDYSGNLEEHPGPIPFEILHQEAAMVRFKSPAVRGPYRLFVEVADNHGGAGYGNVPFFVGELPRAGTTTDKCVSDPHGATT